MTIGKVAAVVVLLAVIGALDVWLVVGRQQARQEEKTEITDVKNVKEVVINDDIMQLTSTAFANNGAIPAKYTCDGEDINPPLAIAGVPAGTKSLVLIVDDPDAPAGDWVHWSVFNIRPDTQEIGENFTRKIGVEGMTDSGSTGYSGPCPPLGTHHYYFKLYALDDLLLDLDSSAKKGDLEQAMEGHVLQQVELIGLYERV